MDKYTNLFKKQRKDIKKYKHFDKLTFFDIKRIDNYIKYDIFDDEYDECIKYRDGTISFKGKKVSVMRLIYHNYINDVSYIYDNKLTDCINMCNCICINIKHLKKRWY